MKDQVPIDLLETIVRRHLVGIETLKVRNSDRLDFHDVYVGGLEQALQAAYQAGVAAGAPQPPPAREPEKEEPVTPLKDYILDLSQATAWPDELTSRAYDCTYNGLMIVPVDRDTPCPYDANFTIEGDDLVIEGGVGCYGYGKCTIRTPKKHEDGTAKAYYRVTLEPDFSEKSGQALRDFPKVKADLERHGVRFRDGNGNYVPPEPGVVKHVTLHFSECMVVPARFGHTAILQPGASLHAGDFYEGVLLNACEGENLTTQDELCVLVAQHLHRLGRLKVTLVSHCGCQELADDEGNDRRAHEERVIELDDDGSTNGEAHHGFFNQRTKYLR